MHSLSLFFGVVLGFFVALLFLYRPGSLRYTSYILWGSLVLSSFINIFLLCFSNPKKKKRFWPQGLDMKKPDCFLLEQSLRRSLYWIILTKHELILTAVVNENSRKR